MRRSVVVMAVLLQLISLFAPRCFGNDKEKYGFYVPRAIEEIYGTWVNTTYPGSNYYLQKIIMEPWGDWRMYHKAEDETFYNGTYILVDRWTDAEGNVWYKEYVRMRNNPYPNFELDKISKSGTVWEYLSNPRDFPTPDNMNPANPYYRIYYRE